ILAKLRSMDREDFAALDEGKEGLYNRLYDLSRTAPTLEALLSAAKTKRYAYARLRRMVLWAYLGLRPGDEPQHPLYLRPLAMNARGRALLANMRREATLPILTKPADVRRLGPQAQRLFEKEAAAADLYSLGYPDLAAAEGGALWKEGPVLL
ncbi:MAG: nucleotidyltransferase family protein, partial [Oscillibacter sp.]|nr:nucleotidyltransferase family protein [Oscillibacter sp.]